MKKIFAVLLACAMLFVGTGVALADEDHTITVSGSGVFQTVPDIVHVNIGVIETKESVTEAQQTMNEKMQGMIDSLHEGGVDVKDIVTQNYTVYPEYDYDPELEKSVLVGYTASSQLAVKIRDMSKAGELIDNAMAAGGNNLNSITFLLADETEAQDAALANAVQDAMRKAQVIAKAAGVELGSVVNCVSIENASNDLIARYAMSTGAEMSDAAASTNLQSGTLDITASVTMTFEIAK